MKIDIRELNVKQNPINSSEEVASEFKENVYDDGDGGIERTLNNFFDTSLLFVNDSNSFKKNINTQVKRVDETIKNVDDKELK